MRRRILEIKLDLKGSCHPNCHLVVEFGIAGLAFKEKIPFESCRIPVRSERANIMVSAAWAEC